MTDDNEAEFEDVALSVAHAVNQELFDTETGKVLGPDADIAARSIRLRVGRRPMVCNLRALYRCLQLEYPQQYELFTKYQVWLLSFKIHLMKDGGYQSVREFGCQVEYPENRAVSIIAQLPTSEFMTVVEGEARTDAQLELNGEVTAAAAAHSSIADVSLGGSIRAKQSVGARVNLSFAMMTANVIATGTGNYAGEWIIKGSRGRPLLGEQAFLHTLLVPKDMKQLSMKIRPHAAVGVWGLPATRLNGKWINLTVSLRDDVSVGVQLA